VHYTAPDGLEDAIAVHREYIAKETLAKVLERRPKLAKSAESTKIDGMEFSFNVVRR